MATSRQGGRSSGASGRIEFGSRQRAAPSPILFVLAAAQADDRPPDRLPIADRQVARGQVGAKEPEGVGPGSAGEADMEPRQVLEAPPSRQGMPEPDAP